MEWGDRGSDDAFRSRALLPVELGNTKSGRAELAPLSHCHIAPDIEQLPLEPFQEREFETLPTPKLLQIFDRIDVGKPELYEMRSHSYNF